LTRGGYKLPLCRVEENDADCIAISRPDAANAVAQVYAIRAPHGPVVTAKTNVFLTKRHYHRSTLHAGALLGHDELTTDEVAPGSDSKIASWRGKACSP
jgi:hypothetical protein